MKAIILESDRLIYKPLSIEHLSHDYVEWLNDPEVYQYMETRGNYTLEKLEDFLNKVKRKDILFWGVHLKDSLLHLGNIKIDPVNDRHGTAEYGIMMGRKSEWGKGYAKEASLTIIDYCFNIIELRKITLGVITNNISAVELYKKIGFKTEGILLKQCIYDGVYHDALRMAIFNPKIHHDE
ncbi:MAG: GNAT family N-acetyltransferase [Bacteroidales bacterium]|nr:GNAT family N-acetyltransferase [Bacteroidales bacterium]